MTFRGYLDDLTWTLKVRLNSIITGLVDSNHSQSIHFTYLITHSILFLKLRAWQWQSFFHEFCRDIKQGFLRVILHFLVLIFHGTFFRFQSDCLMKIKNVGQMGTIVQEIGHRTPLRKMPLLPCYVKSLVSIPVFWNSYWWYAYARIRFSSNNNIRLGWRCSHFLWNSPQASSESSRIRT